MSREDTRLRRLLEEMSDEVQPKNRLPEHVVKRIRLRQGLLAGGTLSLVVLVAIGAFAMVPRRSEPPRPPAQGPCPEPSPVYSDPAQELADVEMAGVEVVSADDVWAVGSSRSEAGGEQKGLFPPASPLIRRWDGSSWTGVELPPGLQSSGALHDVDSTGAEDVWAVGQQGSRALVLHWDGERWSLQEVTGGLADGVSLEGVHAVSSSDVWAVGFRDSGGQAPTTPFAMRWDGKGWTEVSPPGDGALLDVSASGTNAAWAVGHRIPETDENDTGMGAPFEPRPLLFHWDGTSWTEVDDFPGSSGLLGLDGVDVEPNGDVWIAATEWEGPRESFLLHLDDEQWSRIDGLSDQGRPGGAPPVGEDPNPPYLSSFDATADGVWAALSDFDAPPLLVHVSGEKRTVVDLPGSRPQDTVVGLEVAPDGQLWGVGNVGTSGPVSADTEYKSFAVTVCGVGTGP